MTISFGSAGWVRTWLDETRSPFPLLLDQERFLYRAYGLQQSMWRSWHWRNLRYNARAFLRGQRLRFDRGNLHQLGGDFIVDGAGVLRLVHPSRDPTDRPAAAKLIEVLTSARSINSI